MVKRVTLAMTVLEKLSQKHIDIGVVGLCQNSVNE